MGDINALFLNLVLLFIILDLDSYKCDKNWRISNFYILKRCALLDKRALMKVSENNAVRPPYR